MTGLKATNLSSHRALNRISCLTTNFTYFELHRVILDFLLSYEYVYGRKCNNMESNASLTVLIPEFVFAKRFLFNAGEEMKEISTITASIS